MFSTSRLLLVLAVVLFAILPLAPTAPADEILPALVQSVSDAAPMPESVLVDSEDETDEDHRSFCARCPGTLSPPVPDIFPRRVALASPADLSIGIHHQSPGQGPPA